MVPSAVIIVREASNSIFSENCQLALLLSEGVVIKNWLEFFGWERKSVKFVRRK